MPAQSGTVRNRSAAHRWKQGGLTVALAGLLDLNVLATKIGVRVRQHCECVEGLVNVTMLSDYGVLAVRATLGNRTDLMTGMRFRVDTGIGGQAVSTRHAVRVREYAQVAANRDIREVMVDGEGIRAAAGVPLIVDSQALGLLFLGRRDGQPVSEAQLRGLQAIAKEAAPLVGASMQHMRRIEAAISEERLRLATQLHEQMIPYLFGIGAAARRARDTLGSRKGKSLAQIRNIEKMASSANAFARSLMIPLGSLPREHLLDVRIRAARDRFALLSDIVVSFGVQGTPIPLDDAALDTLEAAVVEALSNVAKHARGASAMVSLAYGRGEVSVTVMDDGVGLPGDFTQNSITDPLAGGHFGLTVLSHRLQLLQGTFDIHTNDDGGVTVRASVPAGCA